MTPSQYSPTSQLVELRGNANLATGGTAEDVTDLLPQSTVRIWVRAAKTIGLRLIEHAARRTGLNTGMATTEGVYINGERTTEGDCTGYHSARSLLAAPDVDFAVLETARGAILRRGLAFDRCDVSVVLNVTPDHLGMDGVNSLEELAMVKQVEARVASRAVVLNAEDRLCVDMASRLAAGSSCCILRWIATTRCWRAPASTRYCSMNAPCR